MPAVDDPVEEHRGAERVVTDVRIDRVHRLTDAHLRREMNDGGHVAQRPIERPWLRHRAAQELDALGEIAGLGRAGPVHLGLERVEDSHPRALRDERVDEVRADESGSAGHQHRSIHHVCLS